MKERNGRGSQTLGTRCSAEETTRSGSSTTQQPNQTVQVRESLADNNCSPTLKRNGKSTRRTAEKKVRLVLKSHKVPAEVPGVDFQLEKEPGCSAKPAFGRSPSQRTASPRVRRGARISCRLSISAVAKPVRDAC